MTEGRDASHAEVSLARLRPFQLFFITRVATNAANQMQAVAVGWQVYELTSSALDLGLIGLVQFLPPLVLALVAGQVADRYDRKRILAFCYACETSVAAGLLVLVVIPNPPVVAIYILLFVNGIARTFENPSLQSFLPGLVPREALGRAVTANVSSARIAQLSGPALGGLLYALGPGVVYSCCTAIILIAAIASTFLPRPIESAVRAKATWGAMIAGLGFIRMQSIMLGAMSLDLLSTLFGGVTALLPIFARDILATGPLGLGILRAAPALGALTVAGFMARRPVRRSAGWIMFGAEVVLGGATILFALSQIFWLSVVLLAVVGVGDMVSSVIRQTIVQATAPDALRGRVLAVSTLSVTTSNQLGQFESGITAEWWGAVGSAIFGGAAVFAIVAIWAIGFPALRRVKRPDGAQPSAFT